MVAQHQLPDLIMSDCRLVWERAGIKNPLKIKFQENSTMEKVYFSYSVFLCCVSCVSDIATNNHCTYLGEISLPE